MNLLQSIHSGWAYIVLIVLILATFNAVYKYATNQYFGSRDFSVSLLTLIAMHTQFLIGLFLFFAKDYFDEMSISEVMKNDAVRKLAIEHPITMLIAVVLVTIGYSKHKKKLVSKPKFKMLSVFYSMALILVLYMIPWSQWF